MASFDSTKPHIRHLNSDFNSLKNKDGPHIEQYLTNAQRVLLRAIWDHIVHAGKLVNYAIM